MRILAIIIGLAVTLIGTAGLVHAQLEGSDRGIPPIDSSSNFEVDGILVDTSGETANEARQLGWQDAQRIGWAKLWSRTVNRPESQAPELSDSVLNQIVSGIVVEEEQIGPTRYIARLGLLFDRARTGEMLGVGGAIRRSAPMLVIPVMRTGSTGYALEFRSPWQNAWAQFRTNASPVDYVRPVGTGVDPLLLNAGQMGRRSRGWWRALLDQYGASDIVMPELVLHRAFPGGPAIGRFTAYYGPDAQALGSFELRAADAGQLPRMLAEGVRRLDEIYIRAFNEGLLSPDPSLIPPPPPPPLPQQPGVELAPRAVRPAVPRPVLEDSVTEEPAPDPSPPVIPPASVGNGQVPAPPGQSG